MTSQAFGLAKHAPSGAGELEKRRVMAEGCHRSAPLSDSDLVERLPALVQAERGAMADVIEHLVEMERRRLYLRLAFSSLYRYCIERLGYPEDAALKRHRVAKLALRLPQVLDELRAGTIHLTGLFLLSTYLTEDTRQRCSARRVASRGDRSRSSSRAGSRDRTCRRASSR